MNNNFENEIIRVFQNTTNSYKYYWWYSILNLIKRSDNKIISMDDIAIQMIVSAWYPVNYYKISLGKQDQLTKYINQIKEIKMINNISVDLKDDINESDLFKFLIDNKSFIVIKNIISNLIKYVPFRFINPWFNEIIGMDDSKKNNLILSFQNNPNKIIPYTVNVNTNEIILNQIWFDWIYSNIKIIESFTLFELFKYVEKNNPYVTNISLKLFKPQLRKLSEPTKLWKNYIEIKGTETKSVFENKPLISLDNIAIDHYLPWSLVTHDKLWNLHPIEQEVNSSKSNKIAEKKYLTEFTYLQFNFVQHISKLNPKYLEDYFTLFSISKMELMSISNITFTELLSRKIMIETELATNLGYNTNWSYSNQD
jgi:hypothetical protein